MFTKKAVAELADWAAAAAQGNRELAQDHLQQFRHLGASLIASKEFQRHFEQQHGCKVEPDELECFCKFLGAISNIEADQIEQYGRG
jgi:hypothetical protein